ncbi:hypothetical protein MF672_010960 [Actinomadura sp. ATCC 31491]|uniref:DUF4254 domain-containing protein n=1 Tax=Actinomadura luzonensis TaxID=2805427 RepID=A0ABT0FPR5_9ACTN|nr:hypothetical protein [Actinomadura luzonensis]MCK2214307.1 hypothetical protein [Actinomadura luzonensis]
MDERDHDDRAEIREWDAHVDAMHDPGPREEPEQEPPVDLDAVEAALDAAHLQIRSLGEDARLLVDMLPSVIAELQQRRCSDDLRSMRAEYTVTDGPGPPADAELVTDEQAALVLANNAAKAVWMRWVYADPWQQLSKEPPF